MAEEPTPGMGGVWRHAKGKHYLVLGLADDSNNDAPRAEPQVVYVSLEAEGRTGRPLHVRSLSEFLDRFVLSSDDSTGGSDVR